MSDDKTRLERAVARLTRHGMSRREALKAIMISGMGATVSPLVSQLAWGAEGPGGLPMARPDKPVTMPMNGNPIGDGMKPESGTFTVFNYADYLYKDLLDQFGKTYGVDVQITTFENMDQCITKLANNSVDVDVTEITPDRLISEGTIPKHLASAVVKPDDLGPGSIQYMTLTAKGQKMWQDAYAQFIAGV